MRAIFTTILVLAIVGAVAFYVLTREGPRKPQYTVELDNAFGLTEGSDLKVAGVRAGTIKKLRLDRESHRALVDFEITEPGFGSLRKDVFCESRPQSLIGEYYIDCKPGKDSQKLEDGATINQRNRCPGAGDQEADDGSNPWRPTEDFNCDPSQVLSGK